MPLIVEKERSDSEEEEEETSEEEETEEEDEVEDEEEAKEVSDDGKRVNGKQKICIKKNTKECRVCKAVDHQAGFVGSIYLDCPNKPCYLCKQPGHTTATCPHRAATEHGVSPGIRRNTPNITEFVYQRQLGRHVPLVRPRVPIPKKVSSGIRQLHNRRVTCLEFHPAKDNLLLSGDKSGHIGIWDFDKVYDKTVYETVHNCIVNSMKFAPGNDETIYTSSSDGTVCLTDLDTGLPQGLLDLNPDGWKGPATWRMIYGMDVNANRQLVLAGDNFGNLYQLDARTNKAQGKPVLIHKKGKKVVGLHTNPMDPDIFITAGNDHTARIWDIRRFDSEKELAVLRHTGVVNSAYFSPKTGNKILTTCQDNRIRVWDCIFSDLSTPSREIVHSHNFNRYLTCFRAEWDPKDPTESLMVIGRYISDDFNGVALHPIDLLDANTGQLVAELVDSNVTTISPVTKFHPRLDVLASGSSRSLYIWRPEEETEGSEVGAEQERLRLEQLSRIYDLGLLETGKKRKGKGGGDEDDGDEECFVKNNKKTAGRRGKKL